MLPHTYVNITLGVVVVVNVVFVMYTTIGIVK